MKISVFFFSLFLLTTRCTNAINQANDVMPQLPSIKNVIFDLGGVIIFFSLPQTIEKVRATGVSVPDEVAAKIKTANLMQEHLEYNRGKLTRDEYATAVAKKLFTDKKHQEIAMHILHESERLITILPEGIELVKKVQATGAKTYVLSNMCPDIEMQLMRQDPKFFTYFDGVCLSYQVGHVKPEPEVYQHLLKKFELNPKESIFIDDVTLNVHAAEAFGIRGIVHTSPDATWQELMPHLEQVAG